MWTTLIFVGVTATFVAMTGSMLWHLRWMRRLPALDSLPAARGPVHCSVVIAARDEAARIEGTIRHLFSQRGVEAEFIVVDDRSTDRTGEILRRLATEDPRLRVVRIDELPPDWLGKCHACHLGAAAATGDWILFTDADCWLKPDVIARAVGVAQRDGVEHVTLSPGTVLEGHLARAWHLMFLSSVASWFAGVNRDRPKAHVGFGAFNLVSAAAYRQCGGYEALRLTVVDDIKLGLLLQRAGKRTRSFLGVDDVECHWGTTVRNMVKIMEKNYFAAIDYRVSLVVAGSLFAIVMLGLVAAGLFSGSWQGLVAGLSPFALILPAAVLTRRLGWSQPCALLMPFMIPVFLYALLNSTIVTLRQGGIRWRETFYNLETLRGMNVRSRI